MKRPASDEGLRAEPNLTPLLDLVLQLLMFFMMCVNFVTHQVNEGIQLPDMQSARPMDKRETDVLYLNLNDKGHLEVLGIPPLTSATDMKVYLRRQFQDALALGRESGKGPKVNTTIIIRPDKRVEYKDLFQLMDMCKKVGYKKFQIRAKTLGAPSTI